MSHASMKMNWKRTLAIVLALPLAASLPGCTDEEVAVSIGVLAAGAAVGAIAASSGRHDRHDDHHRECRHGRCWSADDGANADLALALVDQPFAGDSAAALAAKFDLPTGAALQLTDAFDQARAGQPNALFALGLTSDDLRSVASFRRPAPASVSEMSRRLAMPEARTTAFIDALLVDAQAQTRDVNSAYWRSCMAKGTWKTNSNAFCQATFWSGCSPAQGATYCL